MRSIIIAVLAAAFLAACGGGGGEAPAAGPTTIVSASPSPSPSVSASPSASPTASPSPTPTSTPTVSPPTSGFIWGANGHPFNAYPDVSLEQQLDLLVQAGLTQYRVNLAGGGAADKLDALLPLAAARGVTILPIMLHDGSLDNDSADTIYARSRTAAETLARRFAGRIKVWELENELEIYAIIQPCEIRDDGTQYPCAWGPAGGVEALEYYGPRWKKVSAALKGLSDGVKAADPTAKRAMGTAGWGHAGAFDRMAQDGIGWEISVWHAYQLNEDMLKRVAAHGKPIWVTEFNAGDPRSDDDNIQAANVQKLLDGFKAIRATYRIEEISFYELLDESYYSDFEGKQGLVRLVKQANGKWAVGSPKPVFEVLKKAVAGG